MRIKLIKEDPRYVVTDEGDIYFAKEGNRLKPFKNKKGYLLVKLGETDTYSVHRLVAKAFVHNFDPQNLDQVNHIDGNKENNNYSNLEWVDNSGNQVHAYKLGLHNPLRGESNPNAKLNNFLVEEACKLFEQGYGAAEVSRTLEIPHLINALQRVKARDNWKHISVKYNY